MVGSTHVACPGCGAAVTGAYCATCGQRTSSPVLSIRRLLRDVLEDQFSLNGTLPRTLAALFFRPGFLTNEYLRLRISPYVPPFRLYLVASLVFFLVISFRAGPPALTVEDRAEIDSAAAVMRDSAAALRARGQTRRSPIRLAITTDSTQRNWADNINIDLGNERLNHVVRDRLAILGNLPPEVALQRVLRGLLENAPKVIFLLLPLYALLLKLLYLRSKRYYVEHFIFALHVHAFAFVLFLLMALLQGVRYVSGLLVVWLMVYFWLALKRVYRQSWFRTTVRWLVLGWCYGIAVALGLTLALVAAILTA